MTPHRFLATLGFVIAVALLLPARGWAQALGDASEQGKAQELQRPSSQRELDDLFRDLLLYVIGAGTLTGLLTGPSLRMLRHHQDRRFPSRARRYAFSAGAALTAVCEGSYLGVGMGRQINPLSVLTDGGSAYIALLFAVIWYVAAYLAVRLPRWSGRYAMPPYLKGDRS